MWNETAGVFSLVIHAVRLAIEAGVTLGDFVRAIDKIALAAADFEQCGRRPRAARHFADPWLVT